MKIALYIEDGLEQIVLTGATETERAILGKLRDGSRTVEIKRGAFYECNGGWVRHGIFSETQDDMSTIIVLRVKPLPPAPVGGEPYATMNNV